MRITTLLLLLALWGCNNSHYVGQSTTTASQPEVAHDHLLEWKTFATQNHLYWEIGQRPTDAREFYGIATVSKPVNFVTNNILLAEEGGVCEWHVFGETQDRVAENLLAEASNPPVCPAHKIAPLGGGPQ